MSTPNVLIIPPGSPDILTCCHLSSVSPISPCQPTLVALSLYGLLTKTVEVLFLKSGIFSGAVLFGCSIAGGMPLSTGQMQRFPCLGSALMPARSCWAYNWSIPDDIMRTFLWVGHLAPLKLSNHGLPKYWICEYWKGPADLINLVRAVSVMHFKNNIIHYYPLDSEAI